MPASENQHRFYRDKFRSLHYEAFQTWFEELARALHPIGDFQAIRKTQGDGGLDGFVISSQLVYAVYAPARRAQDRDSETAAKMRSDFATACSSLQGQLKAWVFVHNHPEGKLGRLGAKAVNELKTKNPSVEITVLNIDGLWEKLTKLSDESLKRFFGESDSGAAPNSNPLDYKIPGTIKELLSEAERLLEKNLLSDVHHEPENLNKRLIHQARLKYEAALRLSVEHDSLRAYAEAIESLVKVLGMQGEAREGQTKIEQAIEWFSKFTQPDTPKVQRAFATARIAFLYELLDDIHLALNFWNEAARLFDASDDRYEWTQSCAGIARCKGKLGKTADEIAVWEEVRKKVAGNPDHRLLATIANDYAVVCMNLGRLSEAKLSLDESEALAKKFSYEDISFTVRGNRDRLQEKQDSHQVPTLSYADLVEDLFALAAWFPESRDDFLPFWLQCRRPELETAIRTIPGLKLLIIQDSREKFLEVANALQAYGSFFVQMINAAFPETQLSFEHNLVEIPFPFDKPLYSYVDTDYWQRNKNGDVITIPNNGRLPSLYWLTPHTCSSKATGNNGRRIDGFQMHLPQQALDLFFGRTGNDVIKKKLFFLPCSRASLNFDVLSDLRICNELGLVPMYFTGLPSSHNFHSILTARVSLPIPHADPTGGLWKLVASLKHSLIRLSSISEIEVRAEFDDFLAKVEDSARSSSFNDVLNLEVHILRVANQTAGKLQLVFVVRETST